MIDRRTFVAAGAATLLGACVTEGVTSPFSSGNGRPRLRLPRAACDSHIHILDPRFPPTPGWTGPGVDNASVAAYRAFQARIGTERAVVVTPSTYGIDNSATIDALGQFGAGARGVAVIDCYALPADLRQMGEAGITGLRVNFVSPQVWGRTDVQRLQDTARIAADHGWHVQIYARAADLAAMAQQIAGLPTSVVIDHFGYPALGGEGANPAWPAILRLLENGRTWVKLSGPYIASRAGPPGYADLLDHARQLVRAASERLVWGSDWPHRGQSANWPDDAGLIDLLLAWVPDEQQRNAILVTNPARLYGFA